MICLGVARGGEQGRSPGEPGVRCGKCRVSARFSPDGAKAS